MAVEFKRYITAKVDVYTDKEREELIGSRIKTETGYAYKHKSNQTLSASTMKQITYEIEFLEGIDNNV